LEKSFRKAKDWSEATGSGLKETDPGSFEDNLKRRCQYWDELVDVMGNRASTRPGFTTDD